MILFSEPDPPLNSRVQTITLIRHGRPTVSLKTWVPGNRLRQFVDRYNQAEIAPDSFPKDRAIARIQESRWVFTSDLPRTIGSAQKLGCSQPHPPDSDFREVDCWWDMPVPWCLPAWSWIVLIRLIWPFNLITVPETPAIAQNRAARAAQKLIYHSQSGPVVLVGHGGMNTLIARELKRLGWQGANQPSLRHWGESTYSMGGVA